ncbi:MAG: 50S ribosomal protein L1 [Chloroflexi bacterium]|nr:50S ribosomal protein L1 [Chloroflexota bacterium]MQF86582.1 50S ribosomal protein L1 [SAR202 cluster bacterium]|tara:strand:+ start:3706 stop:4419 length:714 start_codon:yes stop_codon:yes gene_type:complete
MAAQSKRYKNALNQIDKDKSYEVSEAIDLLKNASATKFDETVEIHIRTSADPRHADQQLRGVATLPHGLGKTVRVAVFVTGEAARAATEAGAEIVGADDLIEKIDGGFLDFDVAIATPDMMGKIGKLGRVLGRKGLMPNPRTNTVVQPQDIPNAVEEAKKGRVELRMDRTAIIHSPVGKASFDNEKLMENVASVVDTINQLKPSAVKGQFVKTVFLTTTMGPSVQLELGSTMAMKVE